MTYLDWIPPVSTLAVLSIVGWLLRKLIVTRLTASVKHEFNEKLERIKTSNRMREDEFKADLRAQGERIANLSSGALSAMAMRQTALDKRRIVAVEQLWEGIASYAPAKQVSKMMGVINFDYASQRATDDPVVRKMFSIAGGWFDPDKIEREDVDKARPFVSERAWALFTAYETIVTSAVMRLLVLKTGAGPSDYLKTEAIKTVIKYALPNHADLIDRMETGSYHHFLDELEMCLLEELREMMKGGKASKENVEQSRLILEAAEKASAQTSVGRAKMHQKTTEAGSNG